MQFWGLGVLHTRDLPTLVLQLVAIAMRPQWHCFETRLESVGNLPARLLEDVIGCTGDCLGPVATLTQHVITCDLDDVFPLLEIGGNYHCRSEMPGQSVQVWWSSGPSVPLACPFAQCR